MARFEDGCYGSLKGVALIGKVLAGRCKMHYTRVAVGKGSIPEGLTPKTISEPPEYVMDAQIAAVTNPVDGECQVSVQVNSAFVEKGFYVTWIILYAEDPDEGEVAFTTLCLEGEPEWIRPASSIVGKLAHFDIISAVGDVDKVYASIDPEALLTAQEAKALIDAHNADLTAHAAQRHVVATRVRDPNKPTYGLDSGRVSPVLETAPYTGGTEVGVVVSGVLYDAKNMSTRRDGVPDGTIIIKTEEQDND